MSGEPRRKGYAIYDKECLASPKHSIPTPKRKPKTFSKNIILKSIYAELTYKTVSVIHSSKNKDIITNVSLFQFK